MNKVEKLLNDIKNYKDKKMSQIKKIQDKCKHKNTSRWVEYSEINEQCNGCGKWIR